jgi:muramoyltetrapeptide carboxypeptidase LdcA involved in peptidoglycan recycling
MKEFGKENLPVLCNMNFGHTEPKICLPYGALAEIDCEKNLFHSRIRGDKT